MTGSIGRREQNPVAILGGGPVGLALALLLAKRAVPSVVFDARSVEQASADRRLLALSLGSLQTLGCDHRAAALRRRPFWLRSAPSSCPRSASSVAP